MTEFHTTPPNTGEPLPVFIYHPNPVATGAVKASEQTCMRCNQARGFIYARHPYGLKGGLVVCPWCIADGSAAAALGASFVQDVEEGVPSEVAEEIDLRRPGYECWQGEMWLGHCGDACEFHGDARREDLAALTAAEEAAFLSENDWLEDQWDDIKANYEPKGDTSLYRFVCRHCRITRLSVDMS